MKLEERAEQLWSILVLAARNRQVLPYGLIAKAIGAPAAALGGWLDPIQKYCIENDLPPLTAIVVGEETGLPGSGFHAAADVPGAQAAVFALDWLDLRAPRVEDYANAIKRARASTAQAGTSDKLSVEARSILDAFRKIGGVDGAFVEYWDFGDAILWESGGVRDAAVREAIVTLTTEGYVVELDAGLRLTGKGAEYLAR